VFKAHGLVYHSTLGSRVIKRRKSHAMLNEAFVPAIPTWCRVWGLGFGVWGLGFGVWGLGFGVWGLGFRISVFGFRISGFGFRACGVWCLPHPPTPTDPPASSREADAPPRLADLGDHPLDLGSGVAPQNLYLVHLAG